MKKQELDHVLRAAGRITGEKQFIIIGSQALHGKYPDLADDIVKSAEVDLAKYVAFRDKDLVFTGELARRGIVSEERLLTLLDQTQIDEHLRSRIRNQISRDFHAERGFEERAAEKQPPAARTVDDPEAVKARGRAEWLKLRRQAEVESPVSNPTRKRDSSKRSELGRDSGKGLDDDASE